VQVDAGLGHGLVDVDGMGSAVAVEIHLLGVAAEIDRYTGQVDGTDGNFRRRFSDAEECRQAVQLGNTIGGNQIPGTRFGSRKVNVHFQQSPTDQGQRRNRN